VINGNIVTVDKDFLIQQAVAVKNERIIAVGRSRDIRQLDGSKARVIDRRISKVPSNPANWPTSWCLARIF
jgi:predicted amidohydrolase YtcJ